MFMVKLKFKNLSFSQEENNIKVSFLKIFYFYIDNDQLKKISSYKIKKNEIQFDNVLEIKAQKKFSFILEKGFLNLRNSLNNRKAVYIHKNSNIPLIGSIYFGIIDRGTNIIEIRPITGCNLNCIYCSVDEGPSSKKKMDYVVEKDYIVSEIKKLLKYKKANNIEIHINSQGEPLLYAELVQLIKDLKKLKSVNIISIDTNGTLLSKKLVNDLSKAGLTRINLSLNALSPNLAKRIADSHYDINRIKGLAKYIPKKIDLIITPVWIPGINDNEIPKLIEFSKNIGAGKNCPPIGIQKYLNYRSGRNPTKEMSYDIFYERLSQYEKIYNIDLKVKPGFKIIKTKELPKPFKKKQIIQADIVMDGRNPNEKIAIASERLITIPNCYKTGKVKIKITRSKHNIFYGKII